MNINLTRQDLVSLLDGDLQSVGAKANAGLQGESVLSFKREPYLEGSIQVNELPSDSHLPYRYCIVLDQALAKNVLQSLWQTLSSSAVLEWLQMLKPPSAFPAQAFYAVLRDFVDKVQFPGDYVNALEKKQQQAFWQLVMKYFAALSPEQQKRLLPIWRKQPFKCDSDVTAEVQFAEAMLAVHQTPTPEMAASSSTARETKGTDTGKKAAVEAIISQPRLLSRATPLFSYFVKTDNETAELMATVILARGVEIPPIFNALTNALKTASPPQAAKLIGILQAHHQSVLADTRKYWSANLSFLAHWLRNQSFKQAFPDEWNYLYQLLDTLLEKQKDYIGAEDTCLSECMSALLDVCNKPEKLACAQRLFTHYPVEWLFKRIFDAFYAALITNKQTDQHELEQLPSLEQLREFSQHLKENNANQEYLERINELEATVELLQKPDRSEDEVLQLIYLIYHCRREDAGKFLQDCTQDWTGEKIRTLLISEIRAIRHEDDKTRYKSRNKRLRAVIYVLMNQKTRQGLLGQVYDRLSSDTQKALYMDVIEAVLSDLISVHYELSPRSQTNIEKTESIKNLTKKIWHFLSSEAVFSQQGRKMPLYFLLLHALQLSETKVVEAAFRQFDSLSNLLDCLKWLSKYVSEEGKASLLQLLLKLPSKGGDQKGKVIDLIFSKEADRDTVFVIVCRLLETPYIVKYQRRAVKDLFDYLEKKMGVSFKVDSLAEYGANYVKYIEKRYQAYLAGDLKELKLKIDARDIENAWHLSREKSSKINLALQGLIERYKPLNVESELTEFTRYIRDQLGKLVGKDKANAALADPAARAAYIPLVEVLDRDGNPTYDTEGMLRVQYDPKFTTEQRERARYHTALRFLLRDPLERSDDQLDSPQFVQHIVYLYRLAKDADELDYLVEHCYETRREHNSDEKYIATQNFDVASCNPGADARFYRTYCYLNNRYKEVVEQDNQEFNNTQYDDWLDGYLKELIEAMVTEPLSNDAIKLAEKFILYYQVKLDVLPDDEADQALLDKKIRELFAGLSKNDEKWSKLKKAARAIARDFSGARAGHKNSVTEDMLRKLLQRCTQRLAIVLGATHSEGMDETVGQFRELMLETLTSALLLHYFNKNEKLAFNALMLAISEGPLKALCVVNGKNLPLQKLEGLLLKQANALFSSASFDALNESFGKVENFLGAEILARIKTNAIDDAPHALMQWFAQSEEQDFQWEILYNRLQEELGDDFAASIKNKVQKDFLSSVLAGVERCPAGLRRYARVIMPLIDKTELAKTKRIMAEQAMEKMNAYLQAGNLQAVKTFAEAIESLVEPHILANLIGGNWPVAEFCQSILELIQASVNEPSLLIDFLIRVMELFVPANSYWASISPKLLDGLLNAKELCLDNKVVLPFIFNYLCSPLDFLNKINEKIAQAESSDDMTGAAHYKALWSQVKAYFIVVCRHYDCVPPVLTEALQLPQHNSAGLTTVLRQSFFYRGSESWRAVESLADKQIDTNKAAEINNLFSLTKLKALQTKESAFQIESFQRSMPMVAACSY